LRGAAIHLSRLIVLAGDFLGDGEFLVALVFRFAADVRDAVLFVLIDIENFIGYRCALELIYRCRRIDLGLLRVFRCANRKSCG
jgi:hypothetical protein